MSVGLTELSKELPAAASLPLGAETMSVGLTELSKERTRRLRRRWEREL
jgi:hypothetical protein